MSDGLDFLAAQGLDFTGSFFKARNLHGGIPPPLRILGQTIGTPLYEHTAHPFAGAGFPGNHYHRESVAVPWLGITGYRPASGSVAIPSPGYPAFQGPGKFRMYFWFRGVVGQSWWGPRDDIHSDGTGWNHVQNGAAQAVALPSSFHYDLDQFPLVNIYQYFYEDLLDVSGLTNPVLSTENNQRIVPVNATINQSKSGDSPGAYYFDRIVEYSMFVVGSTPPSFGMTSGIEQSNPFTAAQYYLGGPSGNGDDFSSLGIAVLLTGTPRYPGIIWPNDASINPPRIFGSGNIIQASDIAEAGGLRFTNGFEIVFVGGVPESAGSPPRFTDLIPPSLVTTL